MSTKAEELARLTKALINLDMKFAREILPQDSNDMVRLVAMHKARYEFTGVPDVYRHISREWLEHHGFSRHKGMPWPPKGELPE